MKRSIWAPLRSVAIVVLMLASASACGGPAAGAAQDHQGSSSHPMSGLEPVSLAAGDQLKVVATTNIVGDVVQQVGGEKIDLTILMALGVDPHTYVPAPSDTAAIHDAHIVFASGLGLEANLEEMFTHAGGRGILVHVSEGIDPLLPPGVAGNVPDEEEGESDHDHGDADPHVWFDVRNVIHWVESIEATLSALDPNSAEIYRANAVAYIEELEDLDTWVMEQITTIPEANRKLVTNHPAFGYLAERYGLQQMGAVYPISPSAEPSARDIAILQETIREYGVPAIFAESTVNPKLVQQVAKDTGVKLVPLYSGSLGGPGSGAESYVRLIRFDVKAIVDALKGADGQSGRPNRCPEV